MESAVESAVELGSDPAGATGAADPGPAVTRPSALRIVLKTPFYRSAVIALIISGIAVSSTTPQLTLFLVNDLHASVPVAGLYYLVNLVAPVAGFALGSLSDRSRDRLLLYRVCAVVGTVGWLAMAAATRIWMPFVIGALALSVAGGAMGQMFAAVRDELSRHPTGVDNQVIATVRMAFSGGWIVGPVLGSWFGAAFGLRSLLVATAVFSLLQIVALGRRVVPRYVPVGTTVADGSLTAVAPPDRSWRARRPLLIFAGCCVLVMCGDTMKYAFLPIYMADQLHVSDTVRGSVIAIQPFLELILMGPFARLAQRLSAARMVTLGALFGVGAHLAYATSTGVAGLYLGQTLMSCLWAAIAGLGVTVAQQLYPQGIGLASSVFMSSIALAGGLGGAIGGLGTAWLGLPHVFFLPAALSSVGVVGLFVTTRRYRPDDAAFARASGAAASSRR